MNEQQTYLTRAAQARVEAKSAILENARERWLRSEAAWRSMAAQAAHIEKLRAKRTAEHATKAGPTPEIEGGSSRQ